MSAWFLTCRTLRVLPLIRFMKSDVFRTHVELPALSDGRVRFRARRGLDVFAAPRSGWPRGLYSQISLRAMLGEYENRIEKGGLGNIKRNKVS